MNFCATFLTKVLQPHRRRLRVLIPKAKKGWPNSMVVSAIGWRLVRIFGPGLAWFVAEPAQRWLEIQKQSQQD
jgi:hypothetical protein